LTPEFKEFLQLLNLEQIEYLLVGGYAVGAYGYRRYTKDIDIWVAVHPDNEHRIKNVLVRFGFSREGLPTPLFDPVKTMLRLGRPPDQVEILSKISGVQFDSCYARRAMTDLDGVMVPVISLEDLLLNKSSTGRIEDLADVVRLRKLHPPPST